MSPTCLLWLRCVATQAPCVGNAEKGARSSISTKRQIRVLRSFRRIRCCVAREGCILYGIYYRCCTAKKWEWEVDSCMKVVVVGRGPDGCRIRKNLFFFLIYNFYCFIIWVKIFYLLY
jgi:hypothetical protein